MGKLLVLVLGMGVAFGTAYVFLRGKVDAGSPSGASAPKQTLDNVRQAKERNEQDAQKRADETFEKTAHP